MLVSVSWGKSPKRVLRMPSAERAPEREERSAVVVEAEGVEVDGAKETGMSRSRLRWIMDGQEEVPIRGGGARNGEGSGRRGAITSAVAVVAAVVIPVDRLVDAVDAADIGSGSDSAMVVLRLWELEMFGVFGGELSRVFFTFRTEKVECDTQRRLTLKRAG